MDVKIVFKNYGNGKKRIILVNKLDNIAFTSYGERSKEYKYITEKYPDIIKKDCQINAIERHEFAGCQLQCIKGYDCVYYK